MRKPNGYWTFERLKEEALKYQTRGAFAKESASAYNLALIRGLLDRVCAHMKSLHTYWTLERLKEEALKYQTRGAFQKESKNAYQFARKRGLIDQVCVHMLEPYACSVSWTDERLAEEALKYQTRKAFQNGSGSAYQSARKRGVLDEVCWLMTSAYQRFNPQLPSILYYLAVDTRPYDTLYKIGITNRTVEERFKNCELEMIRVLQTWDYENGFEAYQREQEILKEYQDYRFTENETILSSGGNTELFTKDILKLDQRHEQCA